MAPGLNFAVLAGDVTAHDHTLSKDGVNISVSSIQDDTESILDPVSITQDFEELRFEAAASLQLNTSSSTAPRSTQLISSPYNNPGHYLDLSSLDTPSLIFAKALTALKPLRPDYATAPYLDALSFPAVLSLVLSLSSEAGYTWKKHTFYVVIFRSQLKSDIDNDLLYKLDYESHREACESGGLLKYWFGKSNGERRNLATCKFCFCSICRRTRLVYKFDDKC